MNPGAKSFLKLSLCTAALVTGVWFIVAQTSRFLHGNTSANRVWFYDESEKKLYAMPDATIPPDKGVGGISGDGARAIVVEFEKNSDPRQRKIAYLLKYSPELKKVLDASLLARAAGKIFDGTVPSRQSEYVQKNTLVRLVDETDWHPANTPEGRDIIQTWQSWRGPNGSSPRVCPAN